MLVRNPQLTVSEVPFDFGSRSSAGESKAGMREGFRFLRQLVRLRRQVLWLQWMLSTDPSESAQTLPRSPGAGVRGRRADGDRRQYARAGGLHSLLAPRYLLAATLATQVSTSWNFALTETLVFRGPKPGRLFGRGVRFFAVNNLALLLRLPLLAFFVREMHIGVLFGNFLTLCLLFLIRFLIADRLIYAPGDPDTERAVYPSDGVRSRREPVKVLEAAGEDVHGVDRSKPIQARRQLPRLPLRHSRTDDDRQPGATSGTRLLPRAMAAAGRRHRDPDRSRRQADATATRDAYPFCRTGCGSLRGAPGAALAQISGSNSVNQSKVVVGPLLARSPHVVYTNIIEALLRFVMVSRGRVLLHSACVEMGGAGCLLSARTDTGKTGTILTLLREHGARFLSDDMSIVAADGEATAFPKPLTISHHTLRAVQAGDLTC